MNTPAPTTDTLAHEIETLKAQRDCYLASREAYATERDALKAEIEELTVWRNQFGEDAVGFARQCTELREQLAAAQAAGREYIARTDPLLACGPPDDPAGGKCGTCRACALEQLARLREHHLAETCKQTKEILSLREEGKAIAAALKGHDHAFMSPGIVDQCPMCAALATWRAKHAPEETTGGKL